MEAANKKDKEDKSKVNFSKYDMEDLCTHRCHE